MESLYWLVRPRKEKAIVRQDVIQAFTTYRASQQRKQVHMLIRDYIGDENVCQPSCERELEVSLIRIHRPQIMRSFSRDKALTKVATIVAKSRFVSILLLYQ